MNWTEGYNLEALIGVALGLYLFFTGGPDFGGTRGSTISANAGFSTYLEKRRQIDARKRERRGHVRLAGAVLLAGGIVWLAVNLHEVRA